MVISHVTAQLFKNKSFYTNSVDSSELKSLRRALKRIVLSVGAGQEIRLEADVLYAGLIDFE